jgi:hypothetical protein
VQEQIKLFSEVYVPTERGNGVAEEDIFALNKMAASFGYTLSPELMNALGGIDGMTFTAIRTSLTKDLGTITGQDLPWNHVLFRGFPYNTPSSAKHLNDAMWGWFQNHLGLIPNNNSLLGCGHYIDLNKFDMNKYGACPICGHQTDDLERVPVKSVKFEYESVTPLRVLKLATDEKVVQHINTMFARNGSLSRDEKNFLIAFQAVPLDVTVPDKVFRETIPFAHAYTKDVGKTAKLLSGVTDVMRIATFFSDPLEGDLSLAENVKYELTTSQKKQVLKLLEAANNPNTLEDMLRNRERWLKLGTTLAIHSKENRRRYPKTAAAFDILWKKPKTVQTFNRVVERKYRNGQFDAELFSRLIARPGEFMRRLDSVLRNVNAKKGAPKPKPVNNDSIFAVLHGMDLPSPEAPAASEPFSDADVVAAVKKAAGSISLRLLFEVRKYFLHRATGTDKYRIFVPKGTDTRMRIVDDKRRKIPKALLTEIIDALEGEITTRLKVKDSLGIRGVVSDDLKNVLLPFNQRGATSSDVVVTKGSRYPLSKDAKVVRMFIHWKGQSDIDLSTVMMDESCENYSFVSYQRLESAGIHHSGDITSAPNGASEFIDIDLNLARQDGTRYIAMSINMYRGGWYGEYGTFAGYMERDALASGKLYEPQSAKVRFNITAKSKVHVPLILDLKTNEIIVVDVAHGKTQQHSRVSRSMDQFAVLTKAVLTMPERKVTMHDVMSMFVRANFNAEGPEVVFSRDTTPLETALKLLEE